MTNRYTYSDPIFRVEAEQSSNLRLTERSGPLLAIFRILSGTATVKDDFSEKTISFKKNYFKLPFQEKAARSMKGLTENFAEEVSIDHLNEWFGSARNNVSFYKAIEVELLNCLVARQTGRYLESFFFVYRILEGISYSLPLIYTAKSRDFKKSFAQLQKFLAKEDKQGEIAFFRKFLSEIYGGEDFFKTTIKIELSDMVVEELCPVFFKSYKKLVTDEKSITDEVENESIELSFLGFFSFVIELRNRYFHFLQGSWNENLASKDIQYPDYFFKPIVDHAINWVAVVWFEVMQYQFAHIRA